VVDESDSRAPIPFEDQATQHSPLEPVSVTLRSAPVAGDRVGTYVVESTIGHGGMGIVVAAKHERLGDRVAIKLLHPKAAKDAVQVERFVREARATARIKSEHVVRVYDAAAEESTNRPYIVMEFLQGRDLGYVLSTFGAMPLQTAVDYIIQICSAVGAAHALGIVHRDLKPSNFFLTHRPDGTPLLKVLDFGISKALQDDGTPDPRLTETQAVFGSPTYMSPEQIRSSKNVDQRSDMWSLGVALFEMLTGKLPFVADNVAGLLASVIADAPFRVSAFVPNIPPMVEAIVLGCLEKDAAKRIGSAAELATRLAPFASPAGAELAKHVEQYVHGLSKSGSSPSLAAPGTGSSPSLSAPGTGSSPSLPAPPPFSSPSFAPPPPGAVSMPLPPLLPLASPSGPAPPVAFGTTGTDLSATGPAALRATTARRGQARAVALAAAALVLVGVIGGIVYLTRRGPSPERAATGESATPPPATSPALPVTGAPSAAVITAESGDGVAPAPSTPPGVPSGPGTRRGKPGTGGGRGRPAPHASAGAGTTTPSPPPTPAPPASPNLDSRF
jgi:serine/threonine-protein kinase